ncbi:MAG: hypothetical protein R3D51_03425 [Hyphomicrobiaceae bacterium]
MNAEPGAPELFIEVHCSLPNAWPPEPILKFRMKDGAARAAFDEAREVFAVSTGLAQGEVYLASVTAIVDSFVTCKLGLIEVLSKLEEEGEVVEAVQEGSGPSIEK